MDSDFEKFKAFSAERLNAAAYYADPHEKDAEIFNASLTGSKSLFAWTGNATNDEGRRFQVIPGYIDRLTPNALADYYDDCHFIGMHSALFVAINEFAMFCFAQREFFSDVGNASRETSPEPWDHRVPGLWLLDYTKHGGHVTDRHSEALIPRDPGRFEVSQYLAFLMARFVWLHELAHCFNGHVEYVQHHGLALRLCEIADDLELVGFSKRIRNGTGEEVGRTLQCLEFDADQSAFWASCRIQSDELENFEGITMLEPALRHRLTLFGSYAMTWLFEEFQKYLDAREGLTHPEPRLRLQNLFHTAASNVASLIPDFAELNHDVLMQFDAIRAAIPGMYETRHLLSSLQDEDLQAELSAYDERLEALKSELLAFQYNDPVQEDGSR